MRAGGTLDILPDDLRQSMAELRQPQGRARAYRWLFVATVFLVASVFFVSEMTELYFGGLPEYREEMGLRALNQSSACNTPVQAHSQHAIETFIGALPGTARTFLLTVLATTLCRKITAARNQDGSSLAAALLVVGTDGDADTIRRAGWDAIVGALESDLPDEGSSNPQSSWTQAREARKLTQRQAISSAVAKLLLWHWSQPVVYLWMLFVYRCYVASLGLSQMRFAAIVAVREVLYLGSTLLATWQCPVFLLMDPITAWREAENRLEKVMRAAMYVLTPHNYTALCLANRFRSWQRVFLGLAGIQVIADLASCFALAAILAGADGDNTPTALIIGYVLTAFGFLLFFGPLSVVTSLRGAADRTKHSCKRLGLGLSGISLLVALVYIVVLYLAMISVGFNPLCRGFIGTAADPCTPPARCVWAGECIYRSPQFPNSRIVTPEWASTLSNWTGRLDREWSLCCSTFEGCDTAAKFHAACDAHTPTLTVARNSGDGEVNPGNFTFGGFVRPAQIEFLCPFADRSAAGGGQLVGGRLLRRGRKRLPPPNKRLLHRPHVVVGLAVRAVAGPSSALRTHRQKQRLPGRPGGHLAAVGLAGKRPRHRHHLGRRARGVARPMHPRPRLRHLPGHERRDMRGHGQLGGDGRRGVALALTSQHKQIKRRQFISSHHPPAPYPFTPALLKRLQRLELSLSQGPLQQPWPRTLMVALRQGYILYLGTRYLFIPLETV
eukprot:COSAG04_NODE_129_length_24418_cov_207.438217_8_plen_726_part_00